MKIGIIGGTKGLGKTLACFLKKDNFNVIITGRDEKVGKKVSHKLNIEYTSDNLEVAKNVDILVISVPIHVTIDVIKKLAPHMKKGSLIMDVTSVKTQATYTMDEYIPEGVESIPTHPVFGPRTPGFEGQVIVLTPLKKGKWYPKIYNYFKSKNMRIIETNCKHHDNMMGIVQVLTHFSYISTAYAMEKLKVNIKETEEYESPIYNIMIDTIARIVSQNPFLTYSIQKENINGENIRQKFFDAVLELKEVLTSKNQKKFIEIANKSTKNMGDIKAALGRSDKIINSLSEESKYLYESIGSEIGLKHIYSQNIHVGTVKTIKGNFVTIENRNHKTETLKIFNVKILTKEELFEWKKNNSKIYTESISCVFKNTSDKNTIGNVIKKIDNITDVKLTDEYNGPQINEGEISYTYEVSGLSKNSIDDVKKLIKGFGGVIR
ncbi:prephenate dehydrogenase [Methanobrevibacter sp. 87.7]|uniref:prephenate dehydrogenase n=1 Tax=Methanobrevibacter sp. 87.7 TaxID=387957 RepID=UPI000B50DD23|nr:prephenate dehydrogenase [Methanobrevibacter sp. 87.7]OWT32377.1 prephenate dehydrogenase [Methanobrevibacter sp. 87.7]